MLGSTRTAVMAFSGVLLASLLVLTSVSVLVIHQAGQEEIERLRASHLDRVRKELKDYVDTAYAVVETNYRKSTTREYLAERFGRRLRNVVDMTRSVLETQVALVEAGAKSLADAQADALGELRKMRYDDGAGYVQVTDTALPYPTMLMHPVFPEREGQRLDAERYESAYGRRKNLFQASVELALDDGEGFVDYVSNKPTPQGVVPGVPKLSYVRVFEPWGWAIITGFYLDDAVRETIEDTKQVVASMRYDNGVGYFWINDTAKPYPRMIMHPILPDLDGEVLDAPEYETAMGRNENLFVAAVERVQRTGSAYIDYMWPKPTEKGVSEYLPKLSYVRLFEPLGWVIGSGMYVDDIERQVASLERGLEGRIRGLVVKCLLALLVVLLVSAAVLWHLRRRASMPSRTDADPGTPSGSEHVRSPQADESTATAARGDAASEVAAVVREVVAAALAEQTRRAALERVIDQTRRDDPDGALAERVASLERAVAGIHEALDAAVRSDVDPSAEAAGRGPPGPTGAVRHAGEIARERGATR